MQLNAEHLMLVAGIGAFLLTLYWVRSRDLLERYAVLWVAVSLVPLFFGLFPGLIERLAARLHLAYPTLVLFLFLIGFYLFAFSVTIWLTRHYRSSVRLNQELALLAQRVKALERAQNKEPPK